MHSKIIIKFDQVLDGLRVSKTLVCFADLKNERWFGRFRKPCSSLFGPAVPDEREELSPPRSRKGTPQAPSTNDITAHPFYQAQPEPPSPPLPTPAQHQNQPERPPVLSPWTTQRQPNPEPPQQPEAETQSQGGQPQTTDTHREQHLDMNQENATEPQGPGFNPQLEPKPPNWHTFTKSQRTNWRRRNREK